MSEPEPRKPFVAWKDPWIEGQKEFAAPRPTYDGPVPAGAKTRRDCTLAGARIFAALLTVIFFCPLLSALISGQQTLWNDLFREFLFACCAAVPPAFALGTAVGFETYRLLVGSRPFQVVKWTEWSLLVLFFVVVFPVGLFFISYHRRKKIFVDGAEIGWWAPVITFLLAIGLVVFSAQNGYPAEGCVSGGLLSLFASDGIVVNILARWHREGRLAPPRSHKIQFSLGTLLFFVLGLSVWITGLVMWLR